jgi:hypothetical protein
MRLILLSVVIATTMIKAEDSPPSSIREKLHAKLLASFPPPPLTEVKKSEPTVILVKPAENKSSSDSAVVRMAPVVVSESKRDRELEAAIDLQSQKQSFSPTKGGTILKKDVGKARIELGTWGDISGLSILRISW